MTENLDQLAEQLASRPYDIEFETDTLSNGEVVFLVKNPELPGCMAHGTTLSEALENLDEARIDYIYSLLVDKVDVPTPTALQSSTGMSAQRTVNVSQEPIYVYAGTPPGEETQSEVPDPISKTQLRGDLAKRV